MTNDPFGIEKVVGLYDRIRAVNDEPQAQAPSTSLEVSAALAALGLRQSALLNRLYAWHNGIFHINGFLHLIPLEEAVSTYQSYAALVASGSDLQWQPGWFPVADQNGDIQYCLNLETSAVAAIDVEDASWRLIAADYRDLLDALTAAFERGMVAFDPASNVFDIESSAWRDLSAEFGLYDAG